MLWKKKTRICFNSTDFSDIWRFCVLFNCQYNLSSPLSSRTPAEDRLVVLEIAKSCRHAVKVHARYMFCNWIASTVTQATQSAISGLLAQVIVMTIFSRMPTFRSWITGTFIKRLGFLYASNYFRTFFMRTFLVKCRLWNRKKQVMTIFSWRGFSLKSQNFVYGSYETYKTFNKLKFLVKSSLWT